MIRKELMDKYRAIEAEQERVSDRISNLTVDEKKLESKLVYRYNVLVDRLEAVSNQIEFESKWG